MQIGFNISEKEENKVLKDYKKAKEHVKWSLWEYFSPEFINRIDKIIVFNPLDKAEIKRIVKLSLTLFEKRLEKKNITLKYNISVINYISKNVYNPEFWAREVRRYITDNIEDSIAEKIIFSKKKTNFEIKVVKWKLVII
jgi:ATP-dependent Clp protease ATP-binding subunit ClpA